MKNRQLNMLRNQICGNMQSTGRERIKVFPIEAGLGKTTMTIKALIELYEKDKSVKSIFVTKFIDEAKIVEKALKGIGLAIHNKKKKPDHKTIINAPVLIITHAKYIQLCNTDDWESKKTWRLYSEGRSNLIIDEELQLLDIITVNDSDYFIAMKSIELLDYSLLNDFETICQPLAKLLNSIKVKAPQWDQKFELQPLDNMKIACFDKLVKALERTKEWHDIYAEMELLNSEYMESYTVSYNELIDILCRIKAIFRSSTCIYNRRGIHVANKALQYKLLDNNIILDASASMIPIYKLNDLFTVVPMERIVDHSAWEIHVCNLNSSASRKKKYSYFYHCIKLQITKIISKKGNKLLVFGSKEDSEIFQAKYLEFCEENKSKLSFTNSGDIRGKNDWFDYNCCLIIHTFNLPSHLYPLQLEYYLPELSLENSDLIMGVTGKGEERHFGYSDLELMDQLREANLAATTYQASKRINRSNSSKAQVYIITNNMNMINTLVNHLKGAVKKEFMLPDQDKLINKKERTYNRKNPSKYKTRLIKLFSKMAQGKYKRHECENMKGHYTKKWCKDKIGYKGKNFARFINELEVEMIALGIDKNQHKIIVLKDL